MALGASVASSEIRLCELGISTEPLMTQLCEREDGFHLIKHIG